MSQNSRIHYEIQTVIYKVVKKVIKLF